MTEKKKPQHAPIRGYPVVDGEITLGGIKLSQLAERVGSTPFFAYDRGLMTARVEEMRKCLPRQVQLHYAMKANPMPAVVHHMASLVDGLDVASSGEMAVALDTGTSPELISFAGPAKTDRELRQAVAAGVVLNMESFGEMRRVAAFGEQLGIRPKAAIRVNPDFELKSSGMKMGGGPKQFGVDAEQVPDMLKEFAALDLDFQGFHIFSGSQNLRVDSILETQEKTLELAIRLAGDAPCEPPTVNIGGGYGIPYFPGEEPLDLKAAGTGLGELLPAFEEKLPNVEVVIELGRYFVGEAGIYVSKIVDRKVSRGHTFLMTDGGLHHHLAASGNFGQVIRKNYPVEIGNRMAGGEKEEASVVGCLCTPLDLLGNKMELPVAEIGDYVVLFQSGAYGLTASPTAFLGHEAPKEILV